jgi:hypothetical protein
MRNTDRNHLVPSNAGAAQSESAGTAGAMAPSTRPPAPSRRSVLAGVAGLAGTGLAAGQLTAALAAAPPRQAGRARPAAVSEAGHPDEPVVVHVRDVRSGDIELFAGTSQVRLRDQALAARIARAARPAARSAR